MIGAIGEAVSSAVNAVFFTIVSILSLGFFKSFYK
jgi:hypothetical protein